MLETIQKINAGTPGGTPCEKGSETPGEQLGEKPGEQPGEKTLMNLVKKHGSEC